MLSPAYAQKRKDSWAIHIESQLNSLPASMRRVGEYILQNRYRAAELNLNRLARDTHTSKTTIVRFCQRLGFEGFRDFYAAWVDSISAGAHPAEPATECSTIAGALFRETAEDLKRTFHLLDAAAMEQASALIERAPAVYFYGLGDSEGVALCAAHRFTILGKPSRAISTIDALGLEGALFSPNDVLCAISQSGFHPHTHAMNPIYEYFPDGQRLIAVTSNSKSKLAKHAEVLFLTSASNLMVGKRYFTFRACQLAVIDSLAFTYGLARRRADLHGPVYQRLMNVVEASSTSKEAPAETAAKGEGNQADLANDYPAINKEDPL